MRQRGTRQPDRWYVGSRANNPIDRVVGLIKCTVPPRCEASTTSNDVGQIKPPRHAPILCAANGSPRRSPGLPRHYRNLENRRKSSIQGGSANTSWDRKAVAQRSISPILLSWGGEGVKRVVRGCLGITASGSKMQSPAAASSTTDADTQSTLAPTSGCPQSCGCCRRRRS